MSTEPVKPEAPTPEAMTIREHLAELRKMLFLCAGVFLLFAVLAFVFIQPLVNALLRLGPEFDFVYLSPAELVTAYLRLALVAGVVFASPFIRWQGWSFVKPGLLEKERSSVLVALVAGFVFFLIGAVFCYFFALPLTMSFFYNFNTATEITASISFDSYMSFILSMLVVFGCVFEMPVLSYLLARLGILKTGHLKKARKVAIVLIFLCAAIITPPDVVSQVVAALPMLLLYELSIYVCRLAERKRAAGEDTPAE